MKQCKNRDGKLRKGLLFQQDNAAAHKLLVALAAIRDAGFVIEALPCSPDLTTSDHSLFPKLKEDQREERFSTNDEVLCAENRWFDTVRRKFLPCYRFIGTPMGKINHQSILVYHKIRNKFSFSFLFSLRLNLI